MIKVLLVFFIFCFYFQAQAQETPPVDSSSSSDPTVGSDGKKIEKALGRVKKTTEKNSESSSFLPDPDNLDPLNPNNENLRGDEEPVLEDIRQVLDAPKKKSKPKNSNTVQASESDNSASDAKPAKVAKTSKSKKKARKGSNRNPDDPDLSLEKKFNNIYKTYNVNPTPEDVWQEASSRQQARQYKVQKGDTLWSISKILFGDPNFWPKLWSLNKQGILNPHFINPNTTIYFYSGDEDSMPTLSVGERATGVGENAIRLSEAVKSDRPGKIPDSIPLYRNEAYFNSKDRDVVIQLGEYKIFPLEYSNDIYITDAPMKTKVKVQIAEVSKFRCYDGRLLKSIKYIGSLEPQYDIFEKLEDIKTPQGVLSTYKYYGSAEPYKEKFLKVFNCRGLIATDLVIIPKNKIQDYTTKRISDIKEPKVVGGPEVVSQQLFILHQIVFADFGSMDYQPGQTFKVMSQVTDSINGQIKVIEKFGSYAVVIIDEISDTMAVGDRIIAE